VRLPDGSPGNERDLGRVLAGASPSLFRAVFAIGIDDLRQLDTLTTDEVRELLFASSIFGQRRSATKAIKQLGDARDELARPRREDAPANRLAREIVETRAELAGAGREMASFGELSRRATAAEERVMAFSRAVPPAQEPGTPARAVDDVLESSQQGRKLKSLAEPAGVAGARVRAGAVARHLFATRARAAEAGRTGLRPSGTPAQAGRAAAPARFAGLLCAAGGWPARPGWTAERLRQVNEPELLADRVRAARQEQAELSSVQATAAALLDEAEGGLREVAAEGQLALAE